MIVFSIVAVILIALALLFVLPTLLKSDIATAAANTSELRNQVNLNVLRDQLRELDADLAAGTIDQTAYEASKKDIEHRVLEDVQTPVAHVASKSNTRISAALIAIVIPLLALSLYALLGKPAAFNPAEVVADNPAGGVTQQQIADMVSGLAAKLKDKPDDATGWSMLARSYGALGRFGESAAAYAHLDSIMPNNPDVLADYADALGMSQNRSLQGKPEELVNKALSIDPKHIKALALSGSAMFERQDYNGAVTQWKKIIAIAPPESELAKSTLTSIGEAQSLANGGTATEAIAPAAPTTPSAPTAPTAAGNAEVSGHVSIDPTLKSKVADTDTVFIFARAAQGPRFPLAVLRKQVKDLPLDFTLDDSMSMMAEAKLSAFPSVIVGARISKSGSASPSPGDLEGLTDAVKPGAKGLQIVINTERK